MIEVFLVDDRRLILEAIKTILAAEPEIKIVGMAQDGKSAISQIIRLQPDIVLIDVEMPRMDGITATKYISQYFPATKVIVLTSHKNRGYVSQALKAGASGYLEKDSLVKDLKQAIYSLSRGYSYIETRLLNQAVNQIQNSNVRKKTTYLKKYRKNIYSPSTSIFGSQSVKIDITKKSSGESSYHGHTSQNIPISTFSTYNINESDRAEYSNLTAAYRLRRHHVYRQHLEKKLILLFMTISSFVLAVIIF